MSDIFNYDNIYSDVTPQYAADVANSDLPEQKKLMVLTDPEAIKVKMTYDVAQQNPGMFMTMGDPVSYMAAKPYLSEMIDTERELRSYKHDDWLDNLTKGYKTSAAALEINELEAERAQAIEDGDEQKVAEIDTKLFAARDKYSLLEQPRKDGVASTIGNIGASTARVLPETAGVVGSLYATAVLTGTAGPAGTAVGAAKTAASASRLARVFGAIGKHYKGLSAASTAAINFRETQKVSMGEAYSMLTEKFPDMPHEEKYKSANIVSNLAGTSAIITDIFGLGAPVRQVVGSAAARGVGYLASRGLVKKTLTDVEKKVVKDVVVDKVAKGEINAKNWKNISIDAAIWGMKLNKNASIETFQELFEEGLNDQIANGSPVTYWSAATGSLGDIAEIAGDYAWHLESGQPLNPETAEKLNFAKNVYAASLVLGGGLDAAGAAINKIGERQAKTVDNMAKNQQNAKTWDAILESKQKSQLRQKVKGVSDQFFANLGKNETIPSKAYIDVAALDEILRSNMNNDKLQRKIAQLKMDQRMRDAREGDSLVEFTNEELNNIILDPENDTLYQLVKDDLITDPADFSTNDINRMMEDIVSNDPNMANSIKDKNSFYNYVYDRMIAAGEDERSANVNATVFQFLANTMATWGNVPVSMEELMQDINLKIKTGEFAERIPEKPKDKKAKKKKPLSLLAFLKKKGGLKDAGGELKNMDARFSPGLVNNQTGLDLDTARELAEEAGYFGVAAMNNLGATSVSDLLELIRTELGGQKVYSEIDSIPEQQEDMDEAEYRAEEILDENNIDYSRMTLEEKLKLASQLISKPQPEEAGLEGIDIDELLRLYDVLPSTKRLFSFTGENAKNVALNALEEAQELLMQRKASMEEIRKKTGWFLGRDLKWRYEISDADAIVDISKLQSEYLDKKIAERPKEKIYKTIKKKGGQIRLSGKYKLGDFLKHDKLFAAYPQLKDYPVEFGNYNFSGVYSNGNFAFSNNLTDKEYLAEFRSVIMHEVAHAIQDIEGFDRGGTPEQFSTLEELHNELNDKISKLNDVEVILSDAKELGYSNSTLYEGKKISEYKSDLSKLKSDISELKKEISEYREPKERYKDLGGEKEARNVQKRSMLTEEELKNIPPEQTDALDGAMPYIVFDDGSLVPMYPDSEYMLLQQGEQYVAGWFQRNAFESIIALTTAAKPETFAHEAFHLFSNQMIREFNAGRLNKQWERNVKTLAKWAGFEFGEDGKITPNTKGEEKLAVAFTRYLATGKAPVGYLKQMFDMLAEMFMNLYRTLRGTLNKRVTNVFDQIFVPYERHLAEQTRRKLGFIAKPENMSLEAYERYMAEKRSLTIRATTKEIQAALALQKVMTEEVYQAEREQAYNDAYNELMDMPVYQMIDYVRSEKILASSLKYLPDGLTINDKSLVSKNQGMLLSQIAAQFKDVAPTVEDLVRLINETPSKETLANYIADQHMEEWIKENKPELADINSEIAQRNERAFRLSVMEYMMLSDMNMERFNAVHNDMRDAAEYIYGRMPMSKAVSVEHWIEQETKLLQKYEYVTDPKKQAEFKRRQAIINYFAMRSKEERVKFKRFSKKIKKYRSNPDKQDLKTMDGTTWDLLKSILYAFRLTKSQPISNDLMSKKIDNWINECLSEGFTFAGELEKYKDFLIEGPSGDRTTISEFSVMTDIFTLIESIGMMRKQVKVEGVVRNIEDVVAEIAQMFAEKGTKAYTQKSATKDFIIRQTMIKETYLRENMPDSFFEAFVLPLMEGFNQKDKQIAEWQVEIESIIKPIRWKLNDKVMIDGRSYTLQNLLVMMLNGGNTHNLECIVRTLQETFGEDYNYDDYLSAITQAPVELRGMAEAIWDIFDRNLKEFMAVQKEIDGKLLRVVEAEPLTLGDGTVLKGGYYPIGTKHKVKDFTDENAIRQGDGLYATHSFQKERKAGIHGELDLTLETLHTWFYRMAGVLKVAIPYNNFSRVLRNKSFRRIVGEEMSLALEEWIKLANKPDQTNSLLLAADTFASVGILGLDIIRGFTQITGIFSSIGSIPLKYIIKNISITDALSAVKKASELSDYMYSRYAHPQEHLSLYIRAEKAIGGYVKGMSAQHKEAIMKAFMYAIIYGDAIASMNTWKAEYQHQLDLGKSDNVARMQADSAVRTIQGDSTAASRPPILQGNMRFFTKFASYFIAQNSRLVAKGFSGTNKLGEIMGVLFAVCIFAAAADSLIKTFSDTSGDDEEWKKEGIETKMDYYLNHYVNNALSTFGSSIFPAFGLGSKIGPALTGEKVYESKMVGIEWMLKPFVATSGLVSYIKNDDDRKLKNSLKNFLGTGMINRDWSDKITEALLGE